MIPDNKVSIVENISLQIKKELSNESVSRALLATTFKGLDVNSMKQALMEGMIRGFTFQDFLKKDIYAIPFGSGYSLITSIDNSRKLAMRTGQYCGKSAPVFTFEENEEGMKKIDSCTVTVSKNEKGLVGEFTATVFFDEYTKKRDLWLTKPKTMIAKVAEMHALRMAFPEELEKQYIEEEMTPKQESGISSDIKDLRESGDMTMGGFLNDKNSNEKDNNNQNQKDDSAGGAGGPGEGGAGGKGGK